MPLHDTGDTVYAKHDPKQAHLASQLTGAGLCIKLVSHVLNCCKCYIMLALATYTLNLP